MVGLVVFSFDVLDLAPSAIGWLNAATGVGGLLGGALGAVVIRFTRLGRTFVAGVALWGLALGLMALWPVPALAFVAMLLIGVGNAHEDASMFTLIPRLAGAELTGRILGALELLIVVGIGLGSVIAPWLLDVAGARVAFGIVGSVVLVASLGYLVPFGRVDRSLPEPGDEVELLRSLQLFAPLPLVVVEQLAGALEPCSYPAGTVVMRQGDPGDRFHVLVNGAAAVRVDGVDRPPLGPGECFGEIALIRHTLRTATITATTDLTTYTLGREAFLRAISGNQVSTSYADSLVEHRLAGDPRGH
jgi:MFS family permease